MSVHRAQTQLIKHRVIVALKLAALNEEKIAMLETVENKYRDKGDNLQAQLDEVENALKALGLSEAKILDMSMEYRRNNKLGIIPADILEETETPTE